MPGMSQPRPPHTTETREHAYAIALQACAGLSLACAYSSSDEYEAEVIRVRRQAGAYGSRHRGQTIAACAVAAVAAVILVVALAG
jgi:hypothetical protein